MSNLKVGLQLYSIRDKMEEDMEAALRSVKEIGYDYVELAGYFGKSAQEIRELLDKYGLSCVSVHQSLDFYEELGGAGVEYVKALGAEYTVIPWYKKELLYENLDAILEKFAGMGKFLSDNGLKLLYHNHDFEFVGTYGGLVIDKIYSAVDSKYLNPEFDTCWIKYAGYEPTEYLATYSGRIDIVHIKDFYAEKMGGGPVYALIDKDGKEIKNDREANKFKFKPVGEGIQNVPEIIDASIKAGAKYIIVEQDQWYDEDSIECARRSREYLKKLGY